MIKLLLASLVTVVLSAFVNFAQKKAVLGNTNYWVKQCIVGFLFGCAAIFANKFGIADGGVTINVRNAAPLSAGLLFGGPAGIIAGCIGTLERWFGFFGDAGEYTRLGSSISTLLAGFLGAVCRRFMFDNKRPTLIYGFAIGLVSEVIHMLLFFFTNMHDLVYAFGFVEKCALPMTIGNGLTVMASLAGVSFMNKEFFFKRRKQRDLSRTFQFCLLICVLVAFCATCLFTFKIQSELAFKEAEQLLRLNLEDVCADMDASYNKGIQDVIDYLPVWRIGKTGAVLMFDNEFTILTGEHTGEKINSPGLFTVVTGKVLSTNECFTALIYGKPTYCMAVSHNGYYFLAWQPQEEAFFFRSVSIYITVFCEILIFTALFILIYVLIKKLIVENLQKINRTLAVITGGNLDVMVDVRSHKEFASLSDDINTTVSTLKYYIAEAAARIDKELEFAQAIQHSTLPSVFPPYPGRNDFEIYARMDTAKEVGGDFYDFYFVGEDRFVFMIADVSGKGIPAALFMMTAKTIIKSFAERGANVAEVFTSINNKLCENNEASMFVTAWIGSIDLKTGILTFANAGHNPPLIKRGSEGFSFCKDRTGPVLAAMEDTQYRQKELTLEPGDILYLYTDGITEAMDKNEKLYGENRLLELLNTKSGFGMEELCDAVKNDVDLFVGDAPQFDDITMLAFKYMGGRNI